MGIFMKKEEKDFLKAKKYFFENITDDSKKEYEDIFNRIHTNLEAIYDQGWCTDTAYNIYKEGTNAYLVLSENGYAIDNNVEQKKIDLLREQKFLVENKINLELLFNAILDEKEFKSGKWDIKYNANKKEVLNAALKAGYLNEKLNTKKVK